MLYRWIGVIYGVRYDFVGTRGGKIGYLSSIVVNYKAILYNFSNFKILYILISIMGCCESKLLVAPLSDFQPCPKQLASISLYKPELALPSLTMGSDKCSLGSLK